jgi:hypothetical protein
MLALAVSATVSVLGGCDTDASRADRAVDQNLQMAASAQGGSDADQAKVHGYLDAAANKDANASLPQQIRAKTALAASELESATALARQAATNSTKIYLLAREIAGLTRAVASDNQLVAALGKYQPQPVLDALGQQSAAIAGSDDKPDWVKTDGGNLASVAATDKAVAALQGQVSQLEEQIKSASDQRNDLMAKSDQLTEQSKREQREKSVDLFTQGADARKQAADLAAKIDQDDSRLARTKADLAVQMAQQDALKAAAVAVDARKSSVNESWAAIEAQITAIKAHSGTLIGDSTDAPVPTKGPATINGKSAELVKLVKANKVVRDEAVNHYNNAIGFYGDALKRATDLNAKLSDPTHLGAMDRQERADRDAWTIEKDAADPAQFRYLQASAQLDLAEFYAGASNEAKAVASLGSTMKPVLDAAGQPVPTGLDDFNGDMSKAVTDQQKLADAAFKDAVENLSNVTDGAAPPELKHGAYVSAMLAQYGWSLLASSAGDATGAAKHLSEAGTAQANALQGGALPAMLPADLAAAAPAAPGAPATPAAPGGAPAPAGNP